MNIALLPGINSQKRGYSNFVNDARKLGYKIWLGEVKASGAGKCPARIQVFDTSPAGGYTVHTR